MPDSMQGSQDESTPSQMQAWSMPMPSPSPPPAPSRSRWEGWVTCSVPNTCCWPDSSLLSAEV